jgi:cyclic-di-AMP phosphodiesterase PgpH
MAGQTPFLGVSAPFTVALGGAAAAFSVKIVQRRSKTWLFISIISCAYIAAAITMGLLRSREFSEIMLSAGWGITNAVVASLLAIGFLPLLEQVTGITTDQTLLELSDLNGKLLKRLSLEAPGRTRTPSTSPTSRRRRRTPSVPTVSSRGSAPTTTTSASW